MMEKHAGLSFTSCLSEAVVKINGEWIDSTLDSLHCSMSSRQSIEITVAKLNGYFYTTYLHRKCIFMSSLKSGTLSAIC